MKFRREKHQEVILLQMGKVASTAIATTLRSANVNVLQAHLASPHSLHRKMTLLFSPKIPNETADVLYQGFLQEFEVGFKLSRNNTNLEKGSKITILSPVRDPMTWYWSHFAEVFYHYKTQLKPFWIQAGLPKEYYDEEAAFIQLQKTMYSILSQTKLSLEDPEDLPQIVHEANRVDSSGIVGRHIDRFLFPLRWFKEEFLPATDVDVYQHPFDKSVGMGSISTCSHSILLLRYEQLNELFPDVCRFLSIKPMKLRHANISNDKDIPFDVANIRNRSHKLIPDELRARIYTSEYAKHFGYQ